MVNTEQSTDSSVHDIVNLLFTIDQRYIIPLANLLDSYSRNNPEQMTQVYIAHSGLEEKDIQFLRNKLKGDRIKIQSIQIKEKWFSNTPVLARLPEESFYRLMAFHFLPEQVERCLYLDADIYINGSIRKLYDTKLDGNCVAAAGHLHGFHNDINIWRLGLKEQKRYINSGVLLMDLKEIRKRLTVDRVLEKLNKNIWRLYLGDQDMINMLFDGKILLLDEKLYNMDETTYKYYKKEIDFDYIENNTVIIHYNSKNKPWLEGYKGVLNRFYPYGLTG